ncbi:hypothetical protein DE146DRAFT_761009 [Phaeosphaeria sp. MPI-PUGE-AT-0046c]|nr:hypothetical protein DE146DRAFT_761009 [Phaeosphaeria sp. MPI-PUGE-AT-0046c]
MRYAKKFDVILLVETSYDAKTSKHSRLHTGAIEASINMPTYQHAHGYYKAAYRQYMKEHRPGWTYAQITSTLAWLWAYATDEERQVSEDLRDTNSMNLPDTDASTVPDTPKTKDDPPPGTEDEGRIEEEAAAAHVTGDEAQRGPSAKKQRVNTTAFSFWPDPATTDHYRFRFPDTANIDIEGEGLDENRKRQKRWLAAGLSHPEEDDDIRWYGAHLLGAGTTGQVGLWVRVNEENTIEERMAARDVTVAPEYWADPFMWRDQLPREIAIQRRLNERNGHDYHIHRYYADRISFYQRRYRVFNEICDLNHLLSALNYYTREWWPRHVIFRRNEAHPELRDALREGKRSVIEKERKKAWARFVGDPRHPDFTPQIEGQEQDPDFEKWMQISGLENMVGGDLPEEPEDVIPERFIWTVFDQLVDALTILAIGGDVSGSDDKEWKEIVHNDVHLQNIFVKRAEHAENTPLPPTENESNEGIVQYEAHEYPSVVLADFDRSFFDLQSEDDQYADNPVHYMFGETPDNGLAAGRYPPEVWGDFAGHDGEIFQKLDSKTNGQIIWMLLMNLPGRHMILEVPFLDNAGTQGRKLVNGKPYTAKDLEDLLSSNSPFEASGRYTDELKATVRSCLAYRLEDRPTLGELKVITRKHLEVKTTRSGKARSEPEDRLVITLPEAIHEFDIGQHFDRTAPAAAKSKGKGKGKKRSRH